MKQISTLALAAMAAASAAAAAEAPPAMKVALPAGFETFFPATPASARPATLLPADGNALTAPMPRLGAGRDAMRRSPRAEGVSIYGYLNDTNVEDLERAMYSLDLKGGAEFLWQDYLTDWGWSIYTGWKRDNSFWGLAGVKLDGHFMGYALVEFDLSDGTMKQIDYIDLEEEGKQALFVSSAYRTYDDKVYGYSYDEEGDNLAFSVAPADDFHSVTTIRTVSLEETCASMAYDSLTDTMYGVTTEGSLVKIDREGNQTPLYNVTKGISGINPGVATGMAWDPSRDALVYDAYFYDKTTGMVELDPNATNPILLYADPGAEIYSVLFSGQPNAEALSPARATFKSNQFADDSLSGSLIWTLPTTCTDGSPLSGSLSYDYYVDGDKAGSGTGTTGSDVTLSYSDLSNGQHTFSLVCANAGSPDRGEPAVYRCWIGPDAPLAPANVRLTENLISWDVPAGSVHDGYVDYSALTYTVYLNGGRIGETQQTTLSYTLPEGEPFTSYTAEVRATYKGWTSANGVSNYIQYGQPLTMPVHFRPLEKELEMMTLINVDGHVYDDGTEDTWRFTTEMGFPAFASGYNGDDWLILPPMNLDNTEKAYRFEMEIGLVHDVDTSGTYEVCIGTEPTAEAMTRVIIPESRCLHMLGDIIEEFFAVPEAGVYYIGIHTKTNQVSFHVSDIDVSLSNRSADVPVGVNELQAIPGADGALTAAVSFNMPSVTAAGSPLPADRQLTATVSSYSTDLGYNPQRELVATETISGLPGSQQQLEIATAQNYNAIVVTITSDGLTGKGEETIVYTGVVRPYTVNDLKATVSEDNMSMTLTWTPPTEGEEEGPIGDTFLYVIYDYISSAWEYLDEAGWDVCEYTFNVPDNYPLGYMRLGVMAYNAAGLSYHVIGQAAALGHPVEIPWTNDLDNDITYDNAVIVSPTEQYSDVYWMPGDPGELISPIFNLDSGFAFIGYTSETTDRKSRISLPKVSTAGMNDVVLSFDYWGGRYAAPMRLMAQTYEMEEPILIAELPEDAAGWTTYQLRLPDSFQDQGWVALFVDADFPDDQHFAMFSGYSFSSVSGVKETSAFGPAVSGGKGMLTVAGMTGESLTVTDLQGRVVLKRAALEGHNSFPLPAGVYIVKAGETTTKAIIR